LNGGGPEGRGCGALPHFFNRGKLVVARPNGSSDFGCPWKCGFRTSSNHKFGLSIAASPPQSRDMYDVSDPCSTQVLSGVIAQAVREAIGDSLKKWDVQPRLVLR